MAKQQRIYHSWDDSEIIDINLHQDCIGKAIELLGQVDSCTVKFYLSLDELRMLVAQLEAWEPTTPDK